jgi:hypothetical protein
MIDQEENKSFLLHVISSNFLWLLKLQTQTIYGEHTHALLIAITFLGLISPPVNIKANVEWGSFWEKKPFRGSDQVTELGIVCTDRGADCGPHCSVNYTIVRHISFH